MTWRSNDWTEWNGRSGEPLRETRYPLMRLIHFDPSAHVSEEGDDPTRDRADNVGLMVNVSSGGLCLLTKSAPVPGDVLRIQVPMPVPAAHTPTLAEVCWVRVLPSVFERGNAVGLKFLL